MNNYPTTSPTMRAFPSEFLREGGMSLRDWFAGQAIPSSIAEAVRRNQQQLGAIRVSEAAARLAFEIADAMLAERAK